MKIWIATGGTGGHVFPALAVADNLVQRGHKITISYDGRTKDMVKRSKPTSAKMVFVWAGGVGGKSKIKQILALMKIGLSAIALTMRFLFSRPAKMVAFGGYSSVPAILAAHIWRIPIFLHEQNAAIGRANQFSMRWVKTLMTSFQNVKGLQDKKSVVYTGLPVRKEFLDAARENRKPASGNRLLITGGSLGATILDDVVPHSILQLPPAMTKKLFVVHQTRPENVVKLQRLYADAGIKANVLSFIHDMAGEMIAANLIIGRSGASTVIELETIGRPAILVPLGINPDQAANADAFAKLGGGFAIPQSQFTQKWLTATLAELFGNPARLAKMAEKAKVPNDAVNKICDTILA